MFKQKKIISLFLSLALTVTHCNIVCAQNYPYLADFETATTSPASKSYASTDTIVLNNLPWVMPGVYLGAMTINDFKNGVHAARMRLSNNSTGSPGYLEMATDLPFGMDTLFFQTAMYGSETGGRLLISYSSTGGLSWTPLGDTIDVPIHDSPVLISRVINQSGPLRLRIEKAESSNARIDLDDLSLNSFGFIPPLGVVSKSPEGTDIPPSTDGLSIRFDRPVAMGAGVLTLQKSGGTAQNIPVPSAQVSVTDSTALFSGITLVHASAYYVLLSDSSFTSVDGINRNEAITDSTFWHFSTEDTTSSPSIPPLTNLNETFLACNTAQNLMGIFTQTSIDGIQTWSCASDGHQDSFCVRMNGGITAGASDSNEDWLISGLPFDFSAITAPMLSFWEKSRYGGAVSRELKLSTDYTGYGDPNEAHWTVLNIPGFDEAPGADWTLVSGIDLEPFKNDPFYLALSYRCHSGGAYALYYDDIRVTETEGIGPAKENHFSLKVLGPATAIAIPILIELNTAAHIELRIIDLNGRTVYREADLFFPAGQNKYMLRPASLSRGMYLISAGNGKDHAATKMMLEQ